MCLLSLQLSLYCVKVFSASQQHFEILYNTKKDLKILEWPRLDEVDSERFNVYHNKLKTQVEDLNNCKVPNDAFGFLSFEKVFSDCLNNLDFFIYDATQTYEYIKSITIDRNIQCDEDVTRLYDVEFIGKNYLHYLKLLSEAASYYSTETLEDKTRYLAASIHIHQHIEYEKSNNSLIEKMFLRSHVIEKTYNFCIQSLLIKMASTVQVNYERCESLIDSSIQASADNSEFILAPDTAIDRIFELTNISHKLLNVLSSLRYLYYYYTGESLDLK